LFISCDFNVQISSRGLPCVLFAPW
jgi:hypothetical protein